MRTFSYILLLTLIMTSCNKDNRDRYQEQLEITFDIPSGLNLIETHIFEINNVNSFFASGLELNNFTIDEVDEILAGKGSLFLPFNDNIDLNIIEKVVVRVFDGNNPTSKKEMYYRDFVPINQGSTLNLFGGISDLKPILSNEKFSIELRLKLRSFIPTNLKMKLNYGYTVYRKN